jgi:hypothetical protein
MVLCFRWIQNSDRGNGPDPRSMLNTALPGSPRAMVYQDYYGSCYRKENGHTCNDVMEIQTPQSWGCSLTLGGSELQRGE